LETAPVTPDTPAPKRSPAHFFEIFEQLGPGLITGAADDDPSGISTYSVTGATFGLSCLWTAVPDADSPE
jgi:Mn2+/Fe2+ NRAMP family transporter